VDDPAVLTPFLLIYFFFQTNDKKSLVAFATGLQCGAVMRIRSPGSYSAVITARNATNVT
jgi:hypothetical protein